MSSHRSSRRLSRIVALLVVAVLASTALEFVPGRASVAAAEELPAVLPAVEPEPDLPLGQAVTEPATGFVEGVSVEDRKLWTAGSRTWRNPDNSLTTRSFGGVVNYQNALGVWEAIDSSIVPADGGGFKVAAAPYSIRFGATSSASQLVKFTQGDSTVSFAAPLGSLPNIAPVVEGNKITYPGILPGVDLRYVVGRFVLKEDLILTAAPSTLAAPLFQFPLTTTNASLAPRDGGGFDVLGSDGAKVFSIPAGYMSDANPATWAPDKHGPVDLAVSNVAGNKLLSVTPNLAWLLDPARQYPVFVDPSIQTHGNVCFWHGCAGTSVDASVYQQWPDYTWDQNWVGFLGRWSDDVGGEEGPYERVSYLHYDFGVIRYSNVSYGHWQGYHMWKECGGDHFYRLQPTAGPWTNGSGAPDPGYNITWNTRLYNGYGSSHGNYSDKVVGTGWHAHVVTDWVQTWAGGGWANRGVQLHTAGPGGCRFRRVAAHENGDGSDSYFQVDHSDPSPYAPSLSSPGHGANLTGTPQLAAVYSDPNGEPGNVRFNVYRRSDNALVAGGSVGGICSGCTAYWTPPAVGDGNYWWNAYGYDDTSRGGDSSGWWFNVDSTGPGGPSISSSTHPNTTTWYANNTPAFSWSASDTSGICDYAYSMTAGAAADPGTASKGTATGYTSTALADGVWYFNIRAKNCSGLWGSYSSRAARIDANGPAVTVDSSTHPIATSWYTSTRPAFSWSTNDDSGICDYSYVLDQSSSTDPGTTTNANKGTGTSWTSPTDVPEGDSWFHIRAKNCAGVWGGVTHRNARTDPSAPPAPTLSSSTHPNQNQWYTNTTPTFGWSATDLSGINGYSRDLNQASAHTPDDTSEGTATSWTAPSALADGEHWFHVKARNGANTWGTAQAGVGHFRVRVDATKPTNLTASSPSHPDPSKWYADNTPDFAWSSSDISGITDYAYTLDVSSTTNPVPAHAGKGTATTWTSPAVADGTWWFHVAAKNGAGLWSDPVHVKVQVDTGAPTAPFVTSASHPSSATWYPDTTADFTFSSTSLSPVTYLVTVNQLPLGDPDPLTATSTGSTYAAPAVGDGIWYLHVRARNSAGTLGPSTHYQYRVDVTAPTAPVVVASTSHTPNFASSDRTIDITWDGATDVPSGVAGYDWDITNSSTAPGTYANYTADGVGPEQATSSSQPDGERWFHVRTRDRAGNVSADKTFGPIYIDANAPAVPVDLAPTLSADLVAQSDELGLEQWAPYRHTNLGVGSAYTQLRTGNLVAAFDDANVPGTGLNTVVRHVYNSGRADAARHDTGLGAGWTLSASDLEAGLEGVDGAVEDIDVLAGITVAAPRLIGGVFTATGYLLEFTDGDGTTHRFTRRGGPGTVWESPAGVSLRVQEEYEPGNPLVVAAYRLVRPDGVTYRATNLDAGLGLPSTTWKITSVIDRRGNTLTYDYDKVAGKYRLTSITHNRYPTQPTATFDYDPTTARLTALRTWPGLQGVDPATGAAKSWERVQTFDYDSQGRLWRSTKNPDDSTGGRQAQTYTYDPTSGRLATVTDALGRPTTFTYALKAGTTDEWRVDTITDRRNTNGPASNKHVFVYDAPGAPGTTNTVTTVTDPGRPATAYEISTRGPVGNGDNRIAGGNIRRITEPTNDDGGTQKVATTYTWTQNRLTAKTDGANNETSYTYNALGLVTSVTEPAPNATRPGLPAAATVAAVRSTLTYEYPPGYNYAGCTDPTTPGPVSGEATCTAVAQIQRVRLADDAGDDHRRITDFTYLADGNLRTTTQRARADGANDPADRTTIFDYYTRGALKSIDGPRSINDVTTYGTTSDAAYGGYDRSNEPRMIVDADQHPKYFDYTPYRQVAKVVDRDGRTTTKQYDARDNLVAETDGAGDRTTTTYDANNQPLRRTTPRGTATPAADDYTTIYCYDQGGLLRKTSKPAANAAAPSSDVCSPTNIDLLVANREETLTTYNADGTKSRDTNPVGGKTDYTYYPNGALRTVTSDTAPGVARAETYTAYDAAGRTRFTFAPIANNAGNRPETWLTYTPAGDIATETKTMSGTQVATTTYAYNPHRERIETLGPRTVAGETARQSDRYDRFGQHIELARRVKASTDTSARDLVTSYGYDAAGNRETVTQPSGDGASLTTTYTFDALNRVRTQTDPANPGHTSEFEYTAEGDQQARIDKVGTAVARRVDLTYNPDHALQSEVATDFTVTPNKRVATCNFNPASGSDPAGGYDADGNLRYQFRAAGPEGCAARQYRTDTSTYDGSGRLANHTQAVRTATAGSFVTRGQSFTYNADGTLRTATHNGHTFSYGYSVAGWRTSMTDNRDGTPRTATATYLPSGARSGETIGAGGTLGAAAVGSFTYHRDGSLASLAWRKDSPADQSIIRSHTSIAYDNGGLRLEENVQLAQPLGSNASTTPGIAAFTYDTADRLTSWTSPFPVLGTTSRPTTTYGLDDGGNIKTETITASGQPTSTATSTFADGRLEFRRTTQGTTTTDVDFDYTGLGEEKKQTTTTVAAGATTAVAETTTYDPSGRTARVDTGASNLIDYGYDGRDRWAFRTESNPADTTLYFYWGTTNKLAEETDAAGGIKVRYVPDENFDTLEYQRFAKPSVPPILAPYTWLLDDPSGNAGSFIDDNGNVIEQKAYGPYGHTDTGGSGRNLTGGSGSALGYQRDVTDKTTGNIALGPRLYDPSIQQFTTPDGFVAADLDLALGFDTLTANRYLFAAANPVAHFEDGHAPRRKFELPGNKKEQKYCKSANPLRAARCINAEADRQWATSVSQKAMGVPDDGDTNALRHCLISSMLTWRFGAKEARGWLDRHEADADRRHPDFNADLHNNEVGIKIGNNNSAILVRSARDTCRKACLAALKAGRLDVTGGHVQP